MTCPQELISKTVLLFFCLILCFGSTVYCQNSADERTENTDLTPLDLDERLGAFVQKEELDDRIKKLAWKKGDFTFTPYGIIWVSAAYDSQATVPGEFSLYSQSREINDQPFFDIDARTSRLGLFVDGPEIATLPTGTKVRGVLEADFQGTMNQSRNRGGIQLRKAFVELKNEKQQWRWAFGQDWEIISPLYPQMLPYLPAGFAGNIGYRRTQLRFEKGFTHSENFKTLTQVAMTDDFISDFLATPGVSGKSSGIPMFQGRVALSFGEQARCGLPWTIGFSGHIGQQLYTFAPLTGTSLTATAVNKPIRSWSGNVDLDLPITKALRFQGEYYLGENLSGSCGAINQGVDLFRREGIRDQGGWIALHSEFNKLHNNTGWALDVPLDGDVIATALPTAGISFSRTRNTVLFTNFLYNWSKELMTGIEFGFWKTNYRRADLTGTEPVFLPMKAGETFRTEFVVKYLF